jgi:hypothetical protein
MARALVLLLAIAGSVAMLAPSLAQPPAALAEVQPGLWEISGTPGGAAPARLCIADVAAFTRFEHRAKSCSATVLKAAGSLTDIEYSCGPAGFGHSELTVVTPRSLRISTQGISDGLPFNYVLQARRVGDCAVPARH